MEKVSHRAHTPTTLLPTAHTAATSAGRASWTLNSESAGREGSAQATFTWRPLQLPHLVDFFLRTVQLRAVRAVRARWPPLLGFMRRSLPPRARRRPALLAAGPEVEQDGVVGCYAL